MHFILSHTYCFVHRSFGFFCYFTSGFIHFSSSFPNYFYSFLFSLCHTVSQFFLPLCSFIVLRLLFILLFLLPDFTLFYYFFWPPGFPYFPWFSFHLMWEACFFKETLYVCVSGGKTGGRRSRLTIVPWFYRVKHLVLQFCMTRAVQSLTDWWNHCYEYQF